MAIWMEFSVRVRSRLAGLSWCKRNFLTAWRACFVVICRIKQEERPRELPNSKLRDCPFEIELLRKSLSCLPITAWELDTLISSSMTKRKRSEESPELIDSIFNRMFAATGNDADYSLPGGSREDFKKYLIRLKSQVLSDLSSAGGKETKKAAKEFTLEEAVQTFGLTYSTVISQSSQKHYWKIDDLTEANDFEITPCIGEKILQSC